MNTQRIPSIELSAADGMTKLVFEKLTARIGRVPNMPRAKAVVEKRGRIDDNDFKLVSDAGFTPGEISEIVAHVVLNIFTNYFNLVARTDIDWPQISVIV